MHRRSAHDRLISSAEVTADPLPPDGSIDAKDASATPVSAPSLKHERPTADPKQVSRSRVPGGDPRLVAAVIASPEDILRAREIREQLKKEYSDRPNQPSSLWWVGVD